MTMMMDTVLISPVRHDLRAAAASSLNPTSPPTLRQTGTARQQGGGHGHGHGNPHPQTNNTTTSGARQGMDNDKAHNSTQKRRRGRRKTRSPGGSSRGRGSSESSSSERNILKVVLGDLLFETWYGSFYPDELVSAGGHHHHQPHHLQARGNGHGNGQDGIGGGGGSAVGTGRIGGGDVMVERLFVCRWCFRYSRELMPYMAHVRMCPEKDDGPPGQMIYNHDGYSIYEVDGEVHKLFCQNLSLFAKLFLDNKSVCFDLSAFKYYLLVQSTSAQGPPPGSRSTASSVTPSQQVVGFFSKEKMSWDNNNLACILVFPPWQRQGLGKILMGVSYELSKREGRIGGPEKPLSDLGRRGYLSFWSSTIARHILSCPARKPLTIQSISAETFIVPDDVVAALKEMDVFNAKKRAPDTAVVNKTRLKEWAWRMRVDLVPAVDPAGFLEEVVSEEGGEDEEMGDEEEDEELDT